MEKLKTQKTHYKVLRCYQHDMNLGNTRGIKCNAVVYVPQSALT